MYNVVNSVGGRLEPAPTRSVFGASGDDIVRTLAQLTKDVQRFDSMIRNHRHLLKQRGADLGAFDERLIRRQSRRITGGAADLATRAGGALEELRGLAHIGELVSLEALERQRGAGRAEDPPTG